MRILLVCGAGIVSGKEIISLLLLRELKNKGYDCFCIVSSWGSEDFRTRLTELGVPYKMMRIGFISKTLNWPAIRMTLEQALYLPGLYVGYTSVLRRFKPEVIIHTNFHHLFLFYPAISSRQRNFYWSHEIISNTPFYQRLFKLFRKKIDLFIGVSEAVSRSLAAVVGESKVFTIRNGVQMPDQLIHTRTKGDVVVFAIVGQVSANKGHELLFNALKPFVGTPVKFRIKIVGDGLPDYVNHLHSVSKELGLEQYIDWCGFIKDIDKIYEGVDWMVVPTVNPEPLGLIVMEAAMRGIPAIASNAGGLPELIRDGENGYLFTAGDINSMTAAIRKVVDLKNSEFFSERAMSIARSNFGTDKFSALFDTILRTGK